MRENLFQAGIIFCEPKMALCISAFFLNGKFDMTKELKLWKFIETNFLCSIIKKAKVYSFWFV